MSAAAWYLPAEPADADHVGRMARFKAGHPGVILGPIGKSWQARWHDRKHREIVVTRYRLEDLLDRLDEMFPPDGPSG